LPYNSRKGAVKIVESVSTESLYGQMVIFNDSNQHINEDIIFELTNMTMYNTNGSTKVNASVAPGDFKVFLVHRIGEQKCGFKFKAAMK
jgi:predicted membrane protein